MPNKRGRAMAMPRRPNPGIVPYREIPAFLRALRRTGPAGAVKDALEWLILTATRSNETLDARLSDVSGKDATWTLSAARIKSIRPRIEPLSARARTIFATCKKRHSGKGGYIFESAPGTPPTGAALLKAMRVLRPKGVPHGFRYSFQRWARDRGHAPGALAKASLAERRKVMNAWSKFCAGG